MTSRFLTKVSSLIGSLYLPITVLFFLVLVHNHFQLITFELPLDYYESSMQTITATFASGENPYSFKNQPARAAMYPTLYNFLVAPLSALFGNTLQLHRTITGIFILASCLLTYVATNRASNSHANSLAASSLFYAALLYYATPISSPTSLGLFLFLASLFIPWLYQFSNRSLIAALVLGVVAFYGKQYFVAGLGYIALYLFVAKSKKKGVIFGVASLTAFLASLTLVHQSSPYFLDNTVFAAAAMELIASNEFMLMQLREYGLIYLPLLIILTLQWGLTFFTGPRGKPSKFNWSDLDAPLLAGKLDYIWYCAACSLVIFVLVLGKNPGNYLSYLFQLLSPFLLAGIFVSLSRPNKFTALCQVLVFASFYIHYAMLSHDFSVKKIENWRKLEQLIATAEKVYGSPIVLGEILEHDGEIFQNGHTNYFYFAKEKPSFMVKEDSEQTVEHIWQTHTDKVYSMIAAQEFDFIILDHWTYIPNRPPGPHEDINGPTWMKKHYRLREEIPVFLANRPGGGRYGMQIWEPIPKSSSLKTTKP